MAGNLIYVLADGQRLCEDGHWDYRRDHALGDTGELLHHIERCGPCDCHPEEGDLL